MAPEKATFLSDKSWVPFGGAVAAVLILGGAVATYVKTESDASAERRRTNDALSSVVKSLEDAGLETIPHRLSNIETRIDEIKNAGFTRDEALLMLWRLKDVGVPIDDPDTIVKPR